MLRWCRYVFAAGLSFMLAAPAWACDHDDTDGLDVGLVLSGGGAKASTQVGVMQIMDELGIPVHCIAGTSMGAVVGSFYATGYDAVEIGDILKDNDWGTLFRGDVPRRDKSFVEKEREESYFSGNIASYGADGLKLPGGLSSMQGLKTYYRHILRDIPTETDFDALPIPFRAVATNLHHGEVTEFKQGDLVEAILASMAVPGVFAPREIDGQMYVDGGLSSTLPVKTVKDMGADIVIAIDVSNAPLSPGRNISVGATATQITTIVVWRSLQRDLEHMAEGDLLIEPNVDVNISTSAYQRAAEGVEAGRLIGETHRQALLDIKALAAPAKAVQRRGTEPVNAGAIALNNNSVIKDSLILRRFGQDGDLNDPDRLDRRLRNLASFGGFGEVDIGRSNGEAVLTVNENPMGRNLVQIGLNATSNFEGQSEYAILARLTRKPIGPRGGDISLSGEFGTNIGLSAELYQPLGPRGQFFIQPELFATWTRQEIEVFGDRFADLWQRDVGIRGRVGRELGAWGILAVGAEIKDSQFSEILAPNDEFTNFSQTQAGVGLFFAVDTLNRNDWPTSGHRIRTSAIRAFSFEDGIPDTDLIEGSWLGAFEIGDYGALLNLRSGQNTGQRGSSVNNFQLGGFRQLGSFTNNSIYADEFTFGSVEIFKRLTSEGRLLDLPVYAGFIAEYARVPLVIFEGDIDLDLYSASLYLGIDTPLGPLFLGGAYGNDDAASLFFKFGRTF